MRKNDSFHAAYQELESRMMVLAESDRDIYLPNFEPEGPVHYVLICMEPSLGRWARSAEQANSKINEGFRNFLPSDETALLHFSIRRYLCEAGELYHITDLSKGAMLVQHASNKRKERYDRWYELLMDELSLVAKPNAQFIAVGNNVCQQLNRRRFQKSFSSVIHYSGLAGSARNASIKGRENDFQNFKDSICHQDLVNTARDVLLSGKVPIKIHNETMELLEKFQLTDSRKQLIFSYKTVFESIRTKLRIANSE